MTRCRRTIYTAVFLGSIGAAGAASGAPQNNASPATAADRQAGAGGAPANEVTTARPVNPIDYATAHLERIAHALRINERITLDGRLTEPAWDSAEPATNFIQWEPNPGMPASEDTEVRFLYDADNLYIGVRCWDSDPAHLTVTELKKDFEGPQNDTLAIYLSPLHDLQTGFFFGTNPAGARRDSQQMADGGQVNQDWDGVWDVKTTTDEKSWTVEFVIPFKTLRFSSSPRQEWGLNVLRRIRRANEDTHWSPLPRRYRIGRASLAGTLTGLENIRQGRNLKIKPYVSSSAIQLASTQYRRDFNASGGLDVKYGLRPSVTLDLTYRTDFSQVEVDQQQVNLTRFNLFFPEKREFFLENSGTFLVAQGGRGVGAGETNVYPFFSRRIGLSSSGTPIPIIGGARMSGKVGTYDVGLLTMKTQRDGVVPSNTFLVGRVRKIFPGNSTAGAIVTSRNSTVVGDYNRLYGVDGLLRLFEKLEVTSYLLRTETPGRGGRDQARMLRAAWNADDLTLSSGYDQVQPNFRPDVGFVARADTTHYSADASWRPRPQNNTRIRNYTLTGSADYYADQDGHVETRLDSVNAGVLFQGSGTIGVTATNTFDRLAEPFEIQPGVILPAGDYTYLRYAANYSSDSGKPVSGNFNASVGDFWDGHSRSMGGSLILKPSYHLNVTFTVNRNDVRLPHGDFVTTLVGTRVLWAFTSKAFLNSFLQYNATTHQFSTNTRFNLLHRPLSDLYVVYNERRDTTSGALLERGLSVKFTDMFDF